MKKNHILKKVFAIFLSVVVIVGFANTGNFAYADDEMDSAEDILSLDGEAPEGFDDVTDPYGFQGPDEVKNVLTQNELCLQLNNRGYNGGMVYQKFNDLRVSDVGNDTTNGKFYTIFNGWSGKDEINDYVRTASQDGYLQNAKSTAYDSDGDGIRESVAAVGWAGGNTWIISYNSITDTVIKANAGHCHQGALENNGDEGDNEWRAQSFFSITAGDYDGDGTESVVVAVQRYESGSYPCIQEWKVNDSNELVNVMSDNANWVNQAYLNSSMADSDYKYCDLLGMQLATGDFNADGIDDLACLSYTNDMSNKYDDSSSIDLYVPWLATGLGVEGSGIPSSPDKMTAVVNGQDCPASAGIACGDINADGVDEIIIAGYKNYVSKNDSTYEHSFKHVDKDKQIIAAYTFDKGVTARINWQEVASNTWSSSHDWYGTSDYAFPVVGVATAALDGLGGAESVCIDGSIYICTLKSGSGATQFEYEFQEAFTPDYFKYKDNAIGGWTISVTYMQDVVSGYFDEDTPGQQQFVALVAGKKDGSNKYRYIPVIIGKKTNDNGTTSYYSTNVENTEYWTLDDVNPYAHVVAIDCDNDSISLRLSEKNCMWTDPEVLGVLQAAPYFGELGSYDDFNDGGTTVEFSTAYETGSGTSSSQNIGIGMHQEFETPVFGYSLDFGYSGGWEKSVFDSTETETTVAFTTGALDTVILKRTPVYCYLYDTINPMTGEWDEDSYMLTATQTPQYYQLSIDEYNHFVTKYNAQIRKANAKKSEENRLSEEELEAASLKAIDVSANSPLHKEGNPFLYKQGAVSSTIFNLAYSGGSQSVTYAKSTSHEETSSESHGFTFNACAYGKFGDDDVAQAKIGAYFESEFTWGSETSTTTTNGLATSGEVCNILKSDTAEALGISQADVSKYGFQWSFGSWDIDLGAAGTVPVYGYGIGKAKSLHSSVTDVDAYNDGNSIVVVWEDEEAVNGIGKGTIKSLPAFGYDVYLQRNGGEFNKVNTTPVKTTSFDIPEGMVAIGDTIKIKIVKLARSKEDASEVAASTPTTSKELVVQEQENINDQNISIAKGPFSYTGNAIKPKITIKGLTEGEDYKLTYSNNVKPGTATVTISGIRNYYATKVIEFKINICDISKKNVKVYGSTTKTYNGKTQYPSVAIGGLSKNTDFTVGGAKSVGKHKIAIKGKKYCKGVVYTYLTIKPKNATISALTPKFGSLTVKMGTKVSATGGAKYKIQYRVKGTSSWKTVTTTSQSYTIKSLKKGKSYQIRVCAFTTKSGKTYSSGWSKIKTSTAVK